MPPNISTQRLTLNIVTEDDADFMLALVNTPGWLRFIGDRHVHSREESIGYIRRIKSTPGILYWVVSIADTKTPIGIISFIKRNYLEYFDIGFAFLPGYNGHGYAFEATSKVLAAARETETHDTILATTVPLNKSSIKLLTKLGFSFEKETKVLNEDIHIYRNSIERT